MQELAEHVIDQQQRFIVIQTFNLAAVYLSYRSQSAAGLKGIGVSDLCDQVLLLARLFERMGAITNVDPGRIREQVVETLKTHEALLETNNKEEICLKRPAIDTHAIQTVQFKAHRLNDTTMRECLPIVGLQLYVNPCVYWTAMPALMLAAVRRLTSSRCAVARPTVAALREEMAILRQIFAAEFVFSASKQAADFEKTLNNLQNFNLIAVAEDGTVSETKANDKFGDILLATITPYIWTYYQVVKVVAQHFPGNEFTERVCLVQCQNNAELQLRARGQFIHPYCLCLEAISTALLQFNKIGLLEKVKKDDGTVVLRANLPELHRTHCHLQHLCAAQKYEFVADFDITTSRVQAKL